MALTMSPEHRDPMEQEAAETDRLDLFPARGMQALLDRDPDAWQEGDPLPRGWHWLYFRHVVPRSGLDSDGHPARGAFLPPGLLPRRMWAGGRLRFLAPLVLGQRVRRHSRIALVERKDGRSGMLDLVTVAHTIIGPAGIAVEERQDLVFRGPPARDSAVRRVEPPAGPVWHDAFLPDSITLFRFSALTFNGHRVHYDHPYATGEEGYAGLLVHAPLTALLLLDAAERWTGRPTASYAYRAVAPLYAGEPLTIAGRPRDDATGAEVWAMGPENRLGMHARTEWAV